MSNYPSTPGPIGVFDSGYGGLSILKDLRRVLPQYDYLYLGDNARAPYGTRSYDVVYRFTLDAVKALFERGCHLVVLACNTASAKALRTIQQNDLPGLDPSRRVLGVIRPTVEAIGNISKGTVGIMGTPGTVSSGSYDIEIAKFFPHFRTVSQACPMLVPLVENNEASNPGADYFVDKYVEELFAQDADIDTIVLACTHYPLLLPNIQKAVADRAKVITQGEIVADSLKDYLERHPDMATRCTTGGTCRYLTTENPSKFNDLARIFLNTPVKVEHIDI